MILIGLTGRAQSGKDSVADYLEVQHGFFRVAFADPIKEALHAAFWEDMDEGDKEAAIDWIGKSRRELMQTLGTEWGRQIIGEDIWIRRMERLMGADVEHTDTAVVISDVRFENEARWIRERGGKVWLIKRPDATPVRQHSSEDGIPEELLNGIINNVGTLAELHTKVNAALLISLHGIPEIVQEMAQ